MALKNFFASFFAGKDNGISTKQSDNVETFYNIDTNDDNDYSTAVFLHVLSFKPQEIGRTCDDYPRAFAYILHVYNPIKKHKELIADGYFRKATVKEVLGTFKVVELKEILKRNGLSFNGKKAELIDYIANSIDEHLLNLPVMYCVSEKGLNFIDENDDLIQLYTNPYNISYEEYAEAKDSAAQYLKYNDIIWRVFNLREMRCPINAYGQKRNNAWNRARFLKSENRFVDSLYQYIVVLFYDLNDTAFDDETILPSLKKEIFELKEYYSTKMVDRCYSQIDLENKMTKEVFRIILKSIFDGE